MNSGFFPYKNSTVSYRQWGKGKEILILFHGFGDKAALFDVMEPSFGNHYKAYAISLPYHGFTEWKEGLFNKEDIESFIRIILEKENASTFTILGYSMGGKITINMVEIFPDQIKKIFLLAPDGIKTHPLYDIHGLPIWFIRFFKYLLKRPKTFFKLNKVIYKCGFLSKFLYDFTKNHFSTPQQRDRFFNVSESIHDFKPDLEKLKILLNQKDIPVEIFLGERDEVILPESGKIFKERLNNCKVTFLPKGHLLVDEDLNMVFNELILNPDIENTEF
ncbi:MAG: alpha/beta hydrolase [Flammeovirgaceae bacterium]|nr:alpha/beta hydrolase [Flammeovirgaceae bacterium]